jgi:hypothetical protein
MTPPRASIWGLITVLGVGCGNAAVLAIGQLGGGQGQQGQGLGVRRQALEQRGAGEVASTGAYSFAAVDSLRMQAKEVTLETSAPAGQGEGVSAVAWPGGKWIELGAAADVLSFDEPVQLPPGQYAGAQITFDASFEVQAFCRTATKLVYTTPG